MSRDFVNLPPFAPAYRPSGLQLHVTSLTSFYCIGSLMASNWHDRRQTVATGEQVLGQFVKGDTDVDALVAHPSGRTNGELVR